MGVEVGCWVKIEGRIRRVILERMIGLKSVRGVIE